MKVFIPTLKTRKGYKENLLKQLPYKFNITMEDILGECDLPPQNGFLVRKEVEEFIWSGRGLLLLLLNPRGEVGIQLDVSLWSQER